MLAWWTELLPVFIMRRLALKHCQRLPVGSVVFVEARPDVYFRLPNRG